MLGLRRAFALAWLWLMGLSALSAQEPVREQPALVVQQMLPERVRGNQIIPLEIVVKNIGARPADNVTLYDTLPAGFELIDAQPPPDRTRDKLTWLLGRIGGGDARVVRLRLAFKAGAAETKFNNVVDVSFQAQVKSVGQTLVVVPVLDLDVDAPDSVMVGQPVLLKIALKNKGTATADKVVLQTWLSNGLTHPAGTELENDIGQLEAGAAGRIPLEVVPTRPGLAQARIRLHAEDGSAIEKTVQITVQDNPLSLAVRGPNLLYPDLVGLFQLEIANRSKLPAQDLVVQVRLPRPLGFLKASDQGAYDAKSHVIVWHLGALGAGESRTIFWNGVGDELGEFRGEALLSAGGVAYRHVPFATRVVGMGEK